jgi:hypothetical protein
MPARSAPCEAPAPSPPSYVPAPALLFKQAYSALCRTGSVVPHPCALPPLPPDDAPSAVPEPRWRSAAAAAAAPVAADSPPSPPCYDYTPQPCLRLSDAPPSEDDWALLLEALARSHNVTGVEALGDAATAVLCGDAGAGTLLALGRRLVRRELPSVTSVAVDFSSGGGSAASPAPTLLSQPPPPPPPPPRLLRPLTLAGLLLNDGLRRLSLRGAGLDAADASALGRALAVNTSVTALLLSHNPRLGDAGVAALCDGLRDNRHLRQLALCDTGLTDAVLPALAAAVTAYSVGGPRARARAQIEAAAAAVEGSAAAWPFPVLMGADDATAAAAAQLLGAAAVRAATAAELVPIVAVPEPAAAVSAGRAGGGGTTPAGAGAKPATKKTAAAAPSAAVTISPPPPYSPAAACPLPRLRLEPAPGGTTVVHSAAATPPRSPVAASTVTARQPVGGKTAAGPKVAAAAAAADAAAAAAAAAEALSAAYGDESARFTGVGCGGSLRLLDVSHNAGVTRAGLVRLLSELAVFTARGRRGDGSDGDGSSSETAAAAAAPRLALATLVAVGCGAPPPEEVDEAALAAAVERAGEGGGESSEKQSVDEDDGGLTCVVAELRARGTEVVLAL